MKWKVVLDSRLLTEVDESMAAGWLKNVLRHPVRDEAPVTFRLTCD